MLERSTPSLSEYSPNGVRFHQEVLDDWYNNLDFSIGTHELMLSGSVGSGKSLLAAHLIVTHCLEYSGARVLACRRTLPDYKRTLFSKIIEHLEGTEGLKEGKHYTVNQSTAQIKFFNGSEILSGYWADKKYMKFRSLELSMAVIEEAVENKGDDYQAIKEIRMRVGRLPHINKNSIIYCTNPAGPSHELYKYFMVEKSETRHVYYSLTDQNPFLPKTYIEQLKRDLPPREAQRMLYGQWLEIDQERIYYAYKNEINFIRKPYNIDPGSPIRLCFDFNIGIGKPMSVVIGQYNQKDDSWHFFSEVVVEGSRTDSILEEIQSRGLFELNHKFIIHGDATGGARSTASKYSNYEIIDQFLANYKTKTNLKLNYSLAVPKSNPPIRERHNIVNAYCENAKGQNRLFVYQDCKVMDEGMRLTALKKGADYIEDDSKFYQHISTSAGYAICYVHKYKDMVKGGNIV
jgi:Phage terminase large subunit